jgi:glycosyltransferase 2 family protein
VNLGNFLVSDQPLQPQKAPSDRPSTWRNLLRTIGYLLAAAYLVWVMRDFHVVQALREFASVSWKWVILGMAFDIASYGVQALRWKILLTPFGRVRLSRCIRAVFAGLFANLVFPLRPGELLRAYIISDSENISLGKVLGSVGVERLIDLVIATAALGVASLSVDLPLRFRRAAYILGVVTLALLAITVVVIFYLEMKIGEDTDFGKGREGFSARVMSALAVLHAMGTAPSFYLAVLTSLLMPFCQVLALWAMMRSYGSLSLTFFAALVVLLVINLGVSLPNAPANVGSYQFFCVLGLSIFQIEKSTATAFSVFAFIALTFPFIFLGFAALVRSGFSLRSMRQQVTTLPREKLKSSPQPSA